MDGDIGTGRGNLCKGVPVADKRIVSFPTLVKENAVSWETVVTMDFLPTIMELLQVDRPSEQQSWAMDGRSIVPLLKSPSTFRWNETERGPRSIGIAFGSPNLNPNNGWGYRYGPWKLVQGSTSCRQDDCRQPQLFHLETDLGERKDVSKEHPDILKDLQEKFQGWHESVLKSRREESKCRSRTGSGPTNLAHEDDNEAQLSES